MPRGSKPGERRGGRKKGTPNKITQTVKAAFEAAFRDAQADPEHPSNLANFSKEYPKDFITAAAKLIPAEISGKLSGNLTVTPNVSLVVEGMVGKKGKA